MSRFNKKGRRAFTLIEMLVVVLIMGILLAVAIPLYLSSVKTAAVNTAKGNLKTIATAAVAYRVKNGAYPATLAALVTAGDIPSITQDGVTYSFDGADVVTAAETVKSTWGSATAQEDITYTISTGAFNPATGP